MGTVGHIEYKPAEIKIAVKLNGKTGKFYCTYAATLFEDTEINTLRATVLAAIKETYTTLEWIPAIVLTFKATPSRSTRDTSYETVDCALARERKYFAYHPSIGIKQVSWDVSPQHRLTSSADGHRFFDPEQQQGIALPTYTSNSYEGERTLLPYSDDLWVALGEIQHFLRIASQSIGAQLGTPERIHTLVARCRSLFNYATSTQEGDNEGR